MKKIIIFSFIIAFLVFYYVDKWAADAGPLSSSVNVVIPRGANSRSVAEELNQANVINKPWLFRLLARWQGLDKKLRAGEYQFEPRISLWDVMQKIANGDIFYRRITLPEGLSSYEFLALIKNEDALGGELTLLPLEGSMLPETYNYAWGDSKDSIVVQAQKAMEKQLAQSWANRQDNLPIKTPKELLILASIIEKETGLPEERGKVASVFVNRLRKVMRLQTDPTVIYAITKGKIDLERSLTRKDLEREDPYNTYKIYGLPVGPICNPGKDSIMAAANPENTDLLYFVASGRGGHNFAKNLKEHNQNVLKWKSQF